MAMPFDELIGLRGPVSSLLRNLVWFLTFNTAYLGVFACVPKLIGSITFSQYSQSKVISNMTSFFFEQLFLLPFVQFTREEEGTSNLETVLKLLNEETERRNNILKLSDIAKIVLGYLSMAVSIFLIRGVVRFLTKSTTRAGSSSTDQAMAGNAQVNNINFQHFDMDNMNDFERMEMGENMNVMIAQKLEDILECICAITKVSILIFVKMVLFPFLIGIWLDISTLDIYKSCIKDRVVFAGMNIVGFFLLHWAVGITFMLLVTMSILQFREVLHPDILSRIVKPQESQPDMIAYLLQDDGWTHTKRFIPSLAIYIALLALHIWLPAILVSKFGLDDYMPLFRPKMWYIFSEQLQIPIEFLLFHLAMNQMMERYKNCIGEVQHIFLLKICNALHITDNLLPRSVGKFKLRAVIPLRHNLDRRGLSPRLVLDNGVYKPTLIDPFWERLVTLHENGGAAEELIESHLLKIPSSVEERYRDSISEKGEPSDPFHSHIALPIFEKTKLNSPAPVTFAKKLLPPKIGSYRFQKQTKLSKGNLDISIEIWQEIMGEPIPRPPEGWDYMGDNGGAAEQGRWAWGEESKSDIENLVARRTYFFPPDSVDGRVEQLWKSKKFWISLPPILLKLSILLFLSWLTVSCCIYGALSIPLAIGRALYQLLGIPDRYIHDPFVFMIGCLIFDPIQRKVLNYICSKKAVDEESNATPKLKLFMKLPLGKAIILVQAGLLWLLFSPLMLGLNYKILFFDTASIFDFSQIGAFAAMDSSDSSFLDFRYIVHAWAIGLVLIHMVVGLFHLGTFRRGFWARIGRLAAIDENNGNEAAPIPNINNEQHEVANGNGAVDRILNLFTAVALNQEWDKIDRVVLVDETTLPITKKLFYILVGPVVVSSICLTVLMSYSVGDYLSGK